MQAGRQTGFTLIELMVTLVVLVTLAVLAAPAFVDLIEKSRLRGATDDIVNLLNTSRANSVKLQRQVNVSVKSGASWCAGAVSEAGPASAGAAMALANTPCNCLTSASSCVVDSQNAFVSSSSYSGVTLSTVTGSLDYSNNGVTFNPKLGAATDSGGNMLTTAPTVLVLSKTGKYSTKITVSPLGQTNVCVPSTSPFVAGYPSC